MAVATTANMARIGSMHMIVDRYSGHFKVNLCYNRWLTRTVGGLKMSTTLNTITLTKKAEEKVKEILLDQPETFAGLRIQVVGGGCSGFQYRMGFDKNFNDQNDTVFEFDGLKVFIDKSSLLYMNGAEVDYVEGLHGAGFKFNNPNVTGSCGCGSSFSV